MGKRSSIRALAALLVLVSMTGVVVPCAAATSGDTLSLLAGSSPPVPGDAAVDCHCVCHASWIPVQYGTWCGDAAPSFLEAPVPVTPEGFSLPPLGEPPRSA